MPIVSECGFGFTMDRSQGQENEGDNEASAKNGETEPFFIDNEHWTLHYG